MYLQPWVFGGINCPDKAGIAYAYAIGADSYGGSIFAMQVTMFPINFALCSDHSSPDVGEFRQPWPWNVFDGRKICLIEPSGRNEKQACIKDLTHDMHEYGHDSFVPEVGEEEEETERVGKRQKDDRVLTHLWQLRRGTINW